MFWCVVGWNWSSNFHLLHGFWNYISFIDQSHRKEEGMNYEVSFKLSSENQDQHRCEKRLGKTVLLRSWILTDFFPSRTQIICFQGAGTDPPSTLLIFFPTQAAPITLKLCQMLKWCFSYPRCHQSSHLPCQGGLASSGFLFFCFFFQ